MNKTTCLNAELAEYAEKFLSFSFRSPRDSAFRHLFTLSEACATNHRTALWKTLSRLFLRLRVPVAERLCRAGLEMCGASPDRVDRAHQVVSRVSLEHVCGCPRSRRRDQYLAAAVVSRMIGICGYSCRIGGSRRCRSSPASNSPESPPAASLVAAGPASCPSSPRASECQRARGVRE